MVGIVCLWDRYATPYLAKYEELLSSQGVDYEVIFWNRLTEKGKTTVTKDGRYIYLNQFCASGKKKMLSFLQWRSNIIKILKENHYDNLILLSTVPAILLEEYIIGRYTGRYIFDIRDYTLEMVGLFRKLVMRLVNHSVLTTISSKGFLRWLEPSNKIMVNHNITVDESVDFDAPHFANDEKVRFSFVGNVRLDIQTRAMLISLGRREKLEQHFYGRVLSNCDIEQVIKDYGLTNVFLHGPFGVEEKRRIYAETDLINTVYVNAERVEDIPLGDSTPLPNRLYDALIFYRPLVTSRGTYLAELSEKYHLGVNVNGFDASIEEEILDYVRHFNKEEFIRGCDELRKEVIAEEKQFRNTIFQILKDWR